MPNFPSVVALAKFNEIKTFMDISQNLDAIFHHFVSNNPFGPEPFESTSQTILDLFNVHDRQPLLPFISKAIKGVVDVSDVGRNLATLGALTAAIVKSSAERTRPEQSLVKCPRFARPSASKSLTMGLIKPPQRFCLLGVSLLPTGKHWGPLGIKIAGTRGEHDGSSDTRPLATAGTAGTVAILST